MGSAFEVVVIAGADSAEWANENLLGAESEINRIEKLISSWDPNSETNRINANAGKDPLMVDAELYKLIWRSLGLYELTKGAFDITYAGMADIWNFDLKYKKVWPDSAVVEKKRELVNANFIELYEEYQVAITEEGVKIGFGGIGKGYAADATARLLQKQGVKNGVINASGDLFAWGKDEMNQPWKVAITDPKNKGNVRMWLTATNQSVVTSGDYYKYKVLNGVRYAHIINPKTGYPVSGITSVTVVAPSAELADAIATSIFVLGLQKGLELINGLNELECIIIDDHDKIWFSEGIASQID
jgi:thiamine biosynthesis lipoprotein